jgi:hypothetical protein
MKQPMQPLVVDPNGVVRFRENRIVSRLYDYCQERGFGMNELCQMEFSAEDRTQFAQLIGYSLCGFHELPYVSDEDALAASAEARKINSESGGCRDDGCPVHCHGDDDE